MPMPYDALPYRAMVVGTWLCHAMLGYAIMSASSTAAPGQHPSAGSGPHRRPRAIPHPPRRVDTDCQDASDMTNPEKEIRARPV